MLDKSGYKKVSGAINNKLSAEGLKKCNDLIQSKLEDGEEVKKIMKIRDKTAISATTISSAAGGTMGTSMDYGVFQTLYFTNKRIFLMNTNVVNEPLINKSISLKDIIGVYFTTNNVKVLKKENGEPKVKMSRGKLKLFSIIWSVISIAVFLLSIYFNNSSIGVFFGGTGFAAIIYAVAKSIQDKVLQQVQIVCKDGWILNGIVASDDYNECISYLKNLEFK